MTAYRDTGDDDFRDLDHQWAMRFRAMRAERDAAVAKLDAIRALTQPYIVQHKDNFWYVLARDVTRILDGPLP